jgi:hypothetical protein
MDAIKSKLAWIGICAIIALLAFGSAWMIQGNRKDKQFAALNGVKDSSMITFPVVLPTKDSTYYGKPTGLDAKTKEEISKLREIAIEYFRLTKDTSDLAKKSQSAIDSLKSNLENRSESFSVLIQDTIGTRTLTADPVVKSIREYFWSDTLYFHVPQVNTTFTNTTGISTSGAIEMGFGGIVIGGAIGKDNKAVAIGIGGVLLVEVLKNIF